MNSEGEINILDILTKFINKRDKKVPVKEYLQKALNITEFKGLNIDDLVKLIEELAKDKKLRMVAKVQNKEEEVNYYNLTNRHKAIYFASSIYSIGLLDLPDFLDNQLNTIYQGNKNKMSSFLHSILYKYSKKNVRKFLIGSKKRKVIKKWIKQPYVPNFVENTNVVNHTQKKLSIDKKMIILDKIGYLDYLRNEYPNKTPIEYGRYIKNVIHANESSLRRAYSSIIRKDSKSPYHSNNAKNYKDFIESLLKQKNLEKHKDFLIKIYPNLPNDSFWGNFG